jgi:hypothetical protein
MDGGMTEASGGGTASGEGAVVQERTPLRGTTLRRGLGIASLNSGVAYMAYTLEDMKRI